MKFKVATVLNVIKKIGTFHGLWPLDPTTKFFPRFLHEVKRAILILNQIVYIIPLILSAYHNIYDKPFAAIKALGHMGTHIDVLLNLILWKIEENRLQLIFTEITNHTMKVKGEHKNILNTYLNRYFNYQVYTLIACVIALIYYITCPLYSSQPLPNPAWYPFEIKIFTWRYYVVYILQSLGMCQNLSGTLIYVAMTTILFLDITVRLHILSTEIKKVKNEDQLRKCILEHQKIIKSAKIVDHVMRYIVLKAYVVICIAVIFAAIQVVFPKSLLHMAGVIVYVLACLLSVFSYTWAADDMNKASTNVAWALYSSNWTKFAPRTRKYMVVMMCRAQKSLDIAVDGILPALTINFFGKFIMFIISYFMALRTFIIE